MSNIHTVIKTVTDARLTELQDNLDNAADDAHKKRAGVTAVVESDTLLRELEEAAQKVRDFKAQVGETAFGVARPA